MTSNILAAFLILSSYALSASTESTAEFLGVGRLKSKPDYVALQFSVRSECYATPLEAQEATDQIVAKIYSYLQTLKNSQDKYFKILINGGFTSVFSKWHENKEICRNTFQKDTEILMHIDAANQFSARFASIQSHVLKFFENGPRSNFFNRPQTFVTLGTPDARITREHRSQLEREARNLALIDAIAIFKETIKSCAQQPYKIKSIKENLQSAQNFTPRFYKTQAALSNDQLSSAAPVRFDDIQIIKELIITFQVDGPLCFEPSP